MAKTILITGAQTINPGAYYTGYNETMADSAFRWLDDAKHFTKRAELRRAFDAFLDAPEGHLDAQEKFRNVVPKATEEMLKAHQLAAWDKKI